MMELKVFNNTITAYGGRWETRLELPVETEILIPDYLPAVFKIVKCLIEPVVMHNDLAGARWQGDGYLRCTVYYQSDENGARLWRTEQKFSFEKSVELPAGRYAPGPARLWGEVEYCNCRAVSEHRIDLRGAYTLCVAALQLEERDLLTSLADCGIEQRAQTLCGVTPVAAVEKSCTAETTFPLPGTGEAILDIGGCYLSQSCTVQTGQVSCQGILRMEAVYRPEGAEELAVRQKELPVRQTVEMDGATEGDMCCCWGEVLGATLAAADNPNDEPMLTVTWKLHAETWRAVEYTAVADAYSTLCDTQVTVEPCRLLQKAADLDTTIPVSVEDALPDPEGTVRGCFVTLGGVQTVQGEENPAAVRLTGRGVAHVLFADARGEMTCYDKPFTWQLPDAWPGQAADFVVHAGVSVLRVSSSRSGDRMRVEAELAIHGQLLYVQSREVVQTVELGEEFPDKGDGPALYLYYAQPGERIFDIAKRYHARAKDLTAANNLTASGDAAGQETTTQAACLLIPAAL